MTNITKAAQDAQNISNLRQLLIDAGRSISWQCFGECRAFDEFAPGPVRDPGAVIEDIRAALQDKTGEVAVAIDNLHNERRDGMTNAIFPPVQIGTRLFAVQPAPVVPDDHPLMVFAKECELGAYMEHEVPMAARKAIAASQQKGGSAG